MPLAFFLCLLLTLVPDGSSRGSAATGEGPAQGLQHGWGLLQPGFDSLGSDSPAAAGPRLPGHFSRCVSI